ncbi:basic salivary proline-rich protein 2-like [Zonotrichia leucophrys gambelii]|uniref:basic salivary proline-rich protein 2-like n=1 Tax=Zonotrichia leucophrys gambelii TaxID=257770 RepID=UPI0031403EC5
MPAGSRPSLALRQPRGSSVPVPAGCGGGPLTPVPPALRAGAVRAGGTAGSSARSRGANPGTGPSAGTDRRPARPAHAPRHPPEPGPRHRRLRSKRARPPRSRPRVPSPERAPASRQPAAPPLQQARACPDCGAAQRRQRPPAPSRGRRVGTNRGRLTRPRRFPPRRRPRPPSWTGRQGTRASAGQPSAERLQRGTRGAGRRLAELIDERRGPAALSDTRGTHRGYLCPAPTPPPPVQECPRSP